MYQLDNIMNAIRALDFVSDVKLIGSQRDAKNDYYSDIDFIVSIENIKPDIALLKITQMFEKEYHPLWKDYANSLMPQKFLVSMFIDCDNPFSFIDIGILNNNENIYYDKDLFMNDKWIHLTKLWIMNFKYYIRKTDNFSERFVRMMEIAEITNYKNELNGFSLLLDLLSTKRTVSKTYTEKLYKVLKEYS